MKVQEMEI